LRVLLICWFVLLASWAQADLILSQKPPLVDLDGDRGGRIDGSPWSSRELSGAVFTMMYVDPDAKGLNLQVEQALKEARFPPGRYKSIAVINMAATWLPNRVLETLLQKKQQEFRDTIYVKDLSKEVIKRWGVRDDNYNVLAFDREGRLIFYRWGRLSAPDADALVNLIWSKLEP